MAISKASLPGICILVTLHFFSYTFSQDNRYFIYFRDKNNSPYSLSQPSQYLSPEAIMRRQQAGIPVTVKDLPVNPAYLDSLRAGGAQVLMASRWFNGALVEATSSQLTGIMKLSFVDASFKTSRKSTPESGARVSSAIQSLSPADYGPSFSQVSLIGADRMHAEGIKGRGILIAVIDAGFRNADTLSVFDSLFINNRVVATYDFVDREEDVFNDHEHGTEVLSVLAGYREGELIGTAWQANYLLLRSENAAIESLGEEYYWVRAAEYADSAGAKIISSSLGYNEFDDPATSHTYSDMNGNKTVITRAADIAASKGILVVNSVGNEGILPWHYLIAPADGDSVLAVGAVDAAGRYAVFSSAGPAADGRIKPDVCAQGVAVTVAAYTGGTKSMNGTSFAAPLITGLAAGLWQEFPSLSNMDLVYYLRRASSWYTSPDNQCGYGIPDYAIAARLIREGRKDQISLIPNPVEAGNIVLCLPEEETGNRLTVTVYDTRGRMVSEEVIVETALRNQLNTDFTHFPQGMYLIRLTGLHRGYTFKIIKI